MSLKAQTSPNLSYTFVSFKWVTQNLVFRNEKSLPQNTLFPGEGKNSVILKSLRHCSNPLHVLFHPKSNSVSTVSIPITQMRKNEAQKR